MYTKRRCVKVESTQNKPITYNKIKHKKIKSKIFYLLFVVVVVVAFLVETCARFILKIKREKKDSKPTHLQASLMVNEKCLTDKLLPLPLILMLEVLRVEISLKEKKQIFLLSYSYCSYVIWLALLPSFILLLTFTLSTTKERFFLFNKAKKENRRVCNFKRNKAYSFTLQFLLYVSVVLLFFSIYFVFICITKRERQNTRIVNIHRESEKNENISMINVRAWLMLPFNLWPFILLLLLLLLLLYRASLKPITQATIKSTLRLLLQINVNVNVLIAVMLYCVFKRSLIVRFTQFGWVLLRLSVSICVCVCVCVCMCSVTSFKEEEYFFKQNKKPLNNVTFYICSALHCSLFFSLLFFLFSQRTLGFHKRKTKWQILLTKKQQKRKKQNKKKKQEEEEEAESVEDELNRENVLSGVK